MKAVIYTCSEIHYIQVHALHFITSLHGAMLNAMAHFFYRKECRKASEVLTDTISEFRYMLHIMSLQKVSVGERGKTFKWHLIGTKLRPNAHILDACIINDLNMNMTNCQEH